MLKMIEITRELETMYKVRSTGTPSYLSRHIKLYVTFALHRTSYYRNPPPGHISLHCTYCLEISEQLHCR